MSTPAAPRRRRTTLEHIAERVELEARLVIAESRVRALTDALRAVLATLPNEWATSEVQRVRREARALIVEVES